jgi:hypothetical protein
MIFFALSVVRSKSCECCLILSDSLCLSGPVAKNLLPQSQEDAKLDKNEYYILLLIKTLF